MRGVFGERVGLRECRTCRKSIAFLYNNVCDSVVVLIEAHQEDASFPRSSYPAECAIAGVQLEVPGNESVSIVDYVH